MDLARMQENFNRGRINIEDIKKLIDTVGHLQNEKDILFEDNKRLRKAVMDLRKKTTFKVFEENLELNQEIVRLKEELKHELSVSGMQR